MADAIPRDSGNRTFNIQGIADSDGTLRNVLTDDAGHLEVVDAVPPAASVLSGALTGASASTTATLVSIPAGRTWKGEIGANITLGFNSDSDTASAAGQHLVVVAPAGNPVSITTTVSVSSNGQTRASAWAMGELQ